MTGSSSFDLFKKVHSGQINQLDCCIVFSRIDQADFLNVLREYEKCVCVRVWEWVCVGVRLCVRVWIVGVGVGGERE